MPATRSASSSAPRTRTARARRRPSRPRSSRPPRRRRRRTAAARSTNGTIQIADITSPAHLLLDQATISPSTVSFSSTSVSPRFHVTACGANVQGALIYVTAVPYNQFSIPNESADRGRRLGVARYAPARRLPGDAEAAAARDVRAGPQGRRAASRRHLGPPPRLVQGGQVARDLIPGWKHRRVWRRASARRQTLLSRVARGGLAFVRPAPRMQAVRMEPLEPAERPPVADLGPHVRGVIAAVALGFAIGVVGVLVAEALSGLSDEVVYAPLLGAVAVAVWAGRAARRHRRHRRRVGACRLRDHSAAHVVQLCLA